MSWLKRMDGADGTRIVAEHPVLPMISSSVWPMSLRSVAYEQVVRSVLERFEMPTTSGEQPILLADLLELEVMP